MEKVILAVFVLMLGFPVVVQGAAVFETDSFETKAGELNITFIGHGTLLFTFGGKIIHVDPFGRLADYAQLPDADIIFITHEHGDHLDMNAIGSDVDSNSAAHLSKGQNVLYKDGHVKFETKVTVGLGGDNIYTYGGDPALGGGDPNGTPPVDNGDGFPVGYKDAYLVGEKNFP